MKKLILIAFAVMMFAATNADAETANPSECNCDSKWCTCADGCI